VVRDATGADESVSVPLRGVFGRPVFPFALRNGDAVRLIAGVWVLEGGLLGLLMAGLSHEEKKSSTGSPSGVDEPLGKVGDSMSVMATSSGYYAAYAAALFFSSSLYVCRAFFPLQ